MLAIADAGCGRAGGADTSRIGSVDFGSFAGYTEIGPVVRAVSATLTVPLVRTQANTAVASTWVGAEALGADGQEEPFIQVGINEIASEVHNHPLPAGYEAFWTDTDRQDHPWPLFSVHPGDRVIASLKLSRGRWTVFISDGSVYRRIVTAEEGSARLRQAIWTQEDSDKADPRQLAYPTVTGVRFSNLSVNGHAPAGRSLDPLWMSVGRRVYEPLAPDNDAFTLQRPRATEVPARATALLQFENGNDALSNLQYRLASATPKTPRTKIASWASQTYKTLITFTRTLRRQSRPVNARASVRVLSGALRDEVLLTRAVARLSPSDLEVWRTRWEDSVAASQVADAQLLHELHSPV